MMTYEEYTEKVESIIDGIKTAIEAGTDHSTIEGMRYDLFKCQKSYMDDVIDRYKYLYSGEIQEKVVELLEYAVNVSESGNSIVEVDDEKTANEVNEELWYKFGDYLLDSQVYEVGYHWCVDVMFGGLFIPDWDGFGF